MTKYPLSCPYVIGQLEQHSELKSQVLAAINEQKEWEHLVETEDAVDITRCDWSTSRYNYEREWLKILRPALFEHLDKQTKLMGYAIFKIKEIWFQQYNNLSQHGWHVHASNWTNVYYLDLPEGSPKTQFINPFDQTTVAEFDVKEGDILTFPSFVVHKAPVNNSPYTKTIISWNMDTELKPGLYSE